MKKTLIIATVVLIIGLLGIIAVAYTPKIHINIDDISIENYSVLSSKMRSYGLYSPKSDSENIKKVVLKCTLSNSSFIKNVSDVKLHFNNTEHIPTIIAGQNLDTDEPYILNIKPRQTTAYTFTFLADASGLTDEKLLSAVEDIDLYATGEYIGLYFKYTEHQVSELFKCRVN